MALKKRAKKERSMKFQFLFVPPKHRLFRLRGATNWRREECFSTLQILHIIRADYHRDNYLQMSKRIPA